jgi:signal transduction histidine kinase
MSVNTTAKKDTNKRDTAKPPFNSTYKKNNLLILKKLRKSYERLTLKRFRFILSKEMRFLRGQRIRFLFLVEPLFLLYCNFTVWTQPMGREMSARISTSRETDGLGVVATETQTRQQHLVQDPALVAAMLSALDVEGRQRMEALGALASGMAHDINNLLGAIMALVSTAHSYLETDHPAAADLELALGACHKGARLTRTVLDHAKGKSVAAERFALNEVASDVVDLVRRCAGKHAEVSLDLTSEATEIDGDPNALSLALINLCLNSLSAMPAKGSLVLSTRRVHGPSPHWTTFDQWPRRGTFVSVAVTDTGCGMDEHIRKHMFVPFFDAAARRDGTGLGMTLVLSAAASHQGAVEVKSEPGRGTMVALHLPAV